MHTLNWSKLRAESDGDICKHFPEFLGASIALVRCNLTLLFIKQHCMVLQWMRKQATLSCRTQMQFVFSSNLLKLVTKNQCQQRFLQFNQQGK